MGRVSKPSDGYSRFIGESLHPLWECVQRYLSAVWEAVTHPAKAAGLDTGLHGRTRRHGPQFHFGLGKR